jgi:hypothetical protein
MEKAQALHLRFHHHDYLDKFVSSFNEKFELFFEPNKADLIVLLNSENQIFITKLISALEKTHLDLLLKSSPSGCMLAQSCYQDLLDRELQKYNFTNEFNPNYTSYLIYTSNEVIKGLQFLHDIIKSNPDKEFIKGLNILDLIFPSELKFSDLEIAWGLLDLVIRKNKKAYFVLSKFILQNILQQLKIETTLILDGHGGDSLLRIGCEDTLSIAKVESLIQFLFNEINTHQDKNIKKAKEELREKSLSPLTLLKKLILQSCLT